MFRLLAAFALGAGAGSAPSAQAPQYQYRIEDKNIWVTAPDGRSYRIESPCTGLSAATDAGRLYVACGDEGLAIFSLEVPSTPQLEAVRDLGGRVTGFHRVGDEMWVELVRREARPVATLVETLALLPAPAPPAPPPAASPRPKVEASPSDAGTPVAGAEATGDRAAAMVGEILEGRGSRVVVGLGREQGLAPGGRVAFFVTRDIPLGGGEVARQDEIVAVGEVVAASADRAEVELGRNEAVPAGARARPTTAASTANRWLPPRAEGLWEFRFNLRPFLALGGLGFGTVSDAAVGVRLEGAVHLEALFEPLGLGLAREGNIIALAGSAVAAYDTRFFEVGLGAGWSALNNEAGRAVEVDEVPVFENVRSGFALVQVARLGAQDGIHLAARNTFLLYDEAFHYGGTVGELLVPTTDRSWLFARGGGGAAGFGFGELGLRLLLSGNGGRDSFFVSASLGGAALFADREVSCTLPDPGTGQEVRTTCAESFDYAGPMVGFGIEWRP